MSDDADKQGKPKRAGIVWGLALIAAGLALLAASLLGADLTAVGWPVAVIVPGALFVVAAFSAQPGRGLGYLAVPGCVVLATGLVLAAQNVTGDWDSWAYAWALIVPTSAGIGLALAGVQERSRSVRRVGLVLTGAGVVLFVVAEWVTVRIAGIGGRGLGPIFGAILPTVLVLVGLAVLARGVRRGR